MELDAIDSVSRACAAELAITNELVAADTASFVATDAGDRMISDEPDTTMSCVLDVDSLKAMAFTAADDVILPPVEAGPKVIASLAAG
jgi:hypothetical protein